MGKIKEFLDSFSNTQVWKSIVRHGIPRTDRNRALAVLSNVFLHLPPVKVRKSGIKLKYTWCMGGITFLLFLVETFTGPHHYDVLIPPRWNTHTSISSILRSRCRWGSCATVAGSPRW